MAKKQKAKRTKKYSGNRARAMSDRQDYRKGGRVSFDVGGVNSGFGDYGEDYYEDRGRGRGRGRGRDDNIYVPPTDEDLRKAEEARKAAEEAAKKAAEEAAAKAAEEAAEKAAKEAAEAQAAGETTEQKQATRTRVEEGMQGKVPDAAKIPDAQQIDSTIAQKTTTMAEPTDAQTFQASDQPKEAVATSTAAQADETIGQDLTANTMQNIATVGDKDVAVDAASESIFVGGFFGRHFGDRGRKT